MPWKHSVLVVTNETVGSQELRQELWERSQGGPTAITLLLADRASREAEARLDQALAVLRQDGLGVDGRVAHADPFLAVHEEWDPARYDAILISTLPAANSRWLSIGLPQRIARHTGALVSVVSGGPPRREPKSAPRRAGRQATVAP